MRLVDVLGHLGLHHVQVPRQRQVPLAQPHVAHDQLQLFAQRLILDSRLPLRQVNPHPRIAEDVRQLLLLDRVLHRPHHPRHQPQVSHLERHAQRIRAQIDLQIALIRAHVHRPVLRLGQVGRAREQVEARAPRVVRVDRRQDHIQPVHLQTEIHRLRLRIVRHVPRHDLLHQPHQVLQLGLGRVPAGLLHPLRVRVADLPRQMTAILVTPARHVLHPRRQLELQRLHAPRLCRRHGQHRQDVRQRAPQRHPRRRGVATQPLKVNLERLKVLPQKLERLWHRGHRGRRRPDLVPDRLDRHLGQLHVPVLGTRHQQLQVVFELLVLLGELLVSGEDRQVGRLAVPRLFGSGLFLLNERTSEKGSG